MDTQAVLPTVLVVDDDELVRMTLSVLIVSLHYPCLVAKDGQEALKILQSQPVDLVLSDIVMPEMDGMDLLKQIRRHYRSTDVIIATEHSEEFRYADVIQAGAIDYIKKPIDQLELEAKLARASKERSMTQLLEKLSMTDSLTSLSNRRAFDQQFTIEVERAARQRYGLFLAIIDIDNFKDFNDSYGHIEGDRVLSSLADILRECTRTKVDTCSRIGGDEFAVLLPQTTADQATEIVQRILLRFVESNFGRTTLSIGVTSCSRNQKLSLEEDEKRMKAFADQTMHDAKQSGKNCVVCRI